MQQCWYVHPDNIERSRKELNVKIAIVARPDFFMQRNDCRQVIVETTRGVHTRCYLSASNGIPFLIIYGRFDRVRGMSSDINFELTQEVISFLGISHVIGTFVVGSIREDEKAGSVYVPNDLIGMGGYSNSRTKDRAIGFRNVDVLQPFCEETRRVLIESSKSLPFAVKPEGTYVCFHGWPRLETLAELQYYKLIGGDVVGQTLDPELTLAKEAGCHYAALAVTIDDHEIRTRFLANDRTGLNELNRNMVEGRRKTFSVFEAALPALAGLSDGTCSCEEQARLKEKRSEHFYYRPKYLCQSDDDENKQ